MIVEKQLNVFNKANHQIYKFCTCPVIVLVFILLLGEFDLLGIQRYTPNADEIESVSFSSDTGYFNPTSYFSIDSVTDKQIIIDTIVAHKNIIKHKNEIKNTNLSPSTLEHPLDLEDYNITYKLKNGNLFKREYNLTDDLAKKTGLYGLLSDEKVILLNHEYINKPETIKSIELQFNKNGNRQGNIIVIDNPEKIIKFVSTLKTDLIANEIVNLTYNRDFDSDPYLYCETYSGDTSKHIRLYLNENTIKWLEQNNYPNFFN